MVDTLHRARIVAVMPVPPKRLLCQCGRYLGESTATGGYVRLKCPECNAWRKVDIDTAADDGTLIATG